jgi:hypothetical protein
MEIKISKCATKCHVCGNDFSHEQHVHSVATKEAESLERRDYCSVCNPTQKCSVVFCTWDTHYSDPKVLEAERQEILSPLRRLFYSLAESSERLDIAQAFLAAQLLKRQKAFRQIRESEEGENAVRVTLFLDRSGNRLIETRDLHFSYTELDAARTNLLDSLRALESPVPDSESATESAATPESEGIFSKIIQNSNSLNEKDNDLETISTT